MKRLLSVIVAIAMICSLSAPAFAASEEWSATAGSNAWNVIGNWTVTGGSYTQQVPAAGDSVVFDTTGSTFYNISLGGTTTAEIGNLVFQNPGAAYIVGVTVGDKLLIANGGYIQVNSGNNNQQVQAEVVLNATNPNAAINNVSGDSGILTISGNVTSAAGTGTLTLDGTQTGDNLVSGGISGAGTLSVTKSGASKWILSGDNSYTGKTDVQAGTLVATTNATALGAGTLQMSGGKLQLVNDTNLPFNRDTTVTVSSEIDSARSTAGTGVGSTQTLGTLLIGAQVLTVGLGNALSTSGTQGLTFGTVTLTGGATINTVSGGGAAAKLLTLGAIGGAAQNLTIGAATGTSVTIGGAITTTTGTFTSNDSGTINMNGASTYTGTTTVTKGTLKAGVASVANTSGAFGNNSAVTMGNNAATGLDITGFDTQVGSLAGGGAVGGNVALGAATLTVGGSNNLSGSYDGIISGTGNVTTGGTGTLTLTRANTYSGATTIGTGSTLSLTTGTIASSSGVANNGTFTIAADKTIKSLTGAGGTTIGAGNTLTIGDVSNLSSTYTGVIGASAGKLATGGTGTLTLGGANLYTGTTTIAANSTVVANNTSALGNGSAVTNNGTLDVGTTNVTVNAIYTQNANSNLNVTIASPSTSGKITSNANAAVSATSNVNVTVPSSIYIPTNAIFTIIDGAGGAGVNVPGTITSDNYRVTFSSLSSNGDLILTANRSSGGFASNATSGDSNASAVGTVLDNVTSPSADMTTVLNTMEGLSASQTASALDTLVPEVDGGVINTSTTALNNFVGVSIERTESVLKTTQETKDSAKTGISAGDESKLNGMWAKGYGSYLTQGTRQGIRGYNAWNAGTALGVDRLFMDCVTLGVSGGYAYGNVDSDANDANTYINSAQTTIYGGYQNKEMPVFVDMAGSFAYNWYNGTRDISIGNTIQRTANAQYDGQQYGAYLGGGYRFDVTKNIQFTPLLSLQYNHLQLGSYTETEAGALNLSVASQGYDQLQSGLGARIAAPIKCKWGTFTPEAHGKWFYDFIGDNMAVTSNFNGGGASFNSNGAKPALNSFNAGGELTFDFKNNISIIANCDTEMKDEFFGIYGSATVRYSF